MSKKQTKSKANGFLVQGGILAIAGIITKIIGAIYRIPMLNIMGLKGQGYYDIAFQVYSIALIISSYSLPLAVSKLVSARMASGERKNAFRVLKAALTFAVVSGALIFLIVFFGADFIAAKIMGAPVSSYALKVLAPGLFIVAIMGVFRGYFQGMGTMIPTALSQVIEQILNAVVSVVGAMMFLKIGEKAADTKNNPLLSSAYSAAGGTLGTVVGALLGLVFLLLVYYAFRKPMLRKMKRDVNSEIEEYSALFKLLLITIAPVIMSTAIYNIGNVIDSSMYNNIMAAQGKLEDYCVETLGKLGQYYTLFNVPLAVANALGASMIPGLVRAFKSEDKLVVHNKIYMAVRYTMLIAIPSAFAFVVIGKPLLDFIWPNVENSVQAKMFMIGGISLVFYSLSTVTNAVLQGIDRMMKPVKNAFISLIIHLVTLFIMLVLFKWDIYAVIVSKVLFSLCMCYLNARDIYVACGYRQERQKCFIIPTISGAIMAVVTFVLRFVLALVMNGRLATLITIVVAVIVYAFCLLELGGVTREDILGFPKGEKLLKICRKISRKV